MEENNNKKAGFKSFLSKWFNKSLKDVFDWHLYPEEPIEVKSIVEIVVFFIIVSLCGYLYYRWNVVPNRTFEVKIENLGTNKVYNIDNDEPSLIDSVTLCMACDVKFVIPMTTHQEFIKDSVSFSSIFHPIFSNQKHSRFIDASFVIDKDLRKNETIIYDSILLKIHKETGTTKLFENYWNIPSGPVYSYLDSLRKETSENFTYSRDSSVLVYCKQSATLPYFSGFNQNDPYQKSDASVGFHLFGRYLNDSIVSAKEDYISILSSKIFFYDSLFTSKDNSISTQHSMYTKRDWSRFNLLSPFRGGLPLEKPSYFRLEDISQAYVDLKINSLTVDSIILSIDFVGVTEFSKMEPSPDSIGMSSILFYDPIKIFKIRTDGLRFHAKFKELENIQQIRVFSVTAIMSAFVVVFVIFCISAYFKIRKKFNKKYEDPTKQSIVNFFYYLNLIIWSILIYNIIYWSIMYAVYEISVLECNLITTPIVIIIIFCLFRKVRNRFKFVKNKIGIKKIIIYISLIFVAIIFGVNIYKIFRMDVEDILNSGHYQRATHIMYDKILSQDSINDIDYSNLRKALIGSKGLLENNLQKYEVSNESDDNFIILHHKDTLLIYDIYKNIYKKIVIPNIDRISRIDNYITFPLKDGDYFYLQSLRKLNNDIVKVRGAYYLGFTKDSSVIISKDGDSLFYTRLVPKTKLIAKKYIVNSKRTHFYTTSRCINDVFYIPESDSINIYKFEGNVIRRVVNDKRYKKLYWSRINDSIYSTSADDNKRYFLCFSGINYEIIDMNKWEGRHFFEEDGNYWNINRIKLLKEITSQVNNSKFIGIDKDNLYFYNNSKVYTYNENSGSNPIDSVEMKDAPIFLRTTRGTFFKLLDYYNNNCYVYSNKELISVIKNRWDSSIRGGYIIDYHSKYAYPLNNTSDSVYVKGLTKDYETKVFDNWLFGKLNNRLHINYLESDSSLISRNRYLSNSQKRKLIDKLKKYKQYNNNKNE